MLKQYTPPHNPPPHDTSATELEPVDVNEAEVSLEFYKDFCFKFSGRKYCLWNISLGSCKELGNKRNTWNKTVEVVGIGIFLSFFYFSTTRMDSVCKQAEMFRTCKLGCAMIREIAPDFELYISKYALAILS